MPLAFAQPHNMKCNATFTVLASAINAHTCFKAVADPVRAVGACGALQAAAIDTRLVAIQRTILARGRNTLRTPK
jgi:hypothetical protein